MLTTTRSRCARALVTRVLVTRPAALLASVRENYSTAAFSRAAAWGQPFPVLRITEDGFSAQGSFAETQAQHLDPDMEIVQELDTLLHAKKMGIVAHFYMDPELQGILSSLTWKQTCIADSLAMGEAAAKMAQDGSIQSVAVLGVDFMAESVRANLDSNGFPNIPVYRLQQAKIGCSLAASAEQEAYLAYLHHAAREPNSLHVVYINTSLKSKAFAHNLVPTITCTSSNVVQTVLQSFAQLPELKLWYGPDAYMGENLVQMFQYLATLSDEKIRTIHPRHNQKTIHHLLQNFDYFKEGTCVVHHMFGDVVTRRVRDEYGDAFLTAHFEVPGEMFTLALQAQNQDRGVVGSTSNILQFITRKTHEAMRQGSDATLRFVLGTEAGMVTAIVRGVQQILKSQPGSKKPTVDIIFPVAAEAASNQNGHIVPGVPGAEGCSTAGGCATCPFMKMNNIDALLELVTNASPKPQCPDPLELFKPQNYTARINGKTIPQVGTEPIRHMKYLMEHKQLSAQLVQDIRTRRQGMGCPQARARA